MTDYYERLGIEQDATTEVIKKAHRALMKEHHPDKNDGMLTEICRDIQAAYDCLSKPETRAHYDEYGLAQDTKQFEAVQKLAIQVSTHVLGQGTKPSQFIFEIDYQLRTALEGYRQQVESATANIKAIQTQRDAIRLKDENQLDLVGAALEEMIEQQLANKAQLQETIDTYEALLKNIDQYEQ
jgi:DnaJ-class molecular chaperone